MNSNNYMLVMDKSTSEKMADWFSRFYFTNHTKANTEKFLFGFFGYLAGKNIPWLDVPFYINSIQREEFPRGLRKAWSTNALEGKPELSAEEKEERSMDAFIRAKRDMIKRYMELLMLYLKLRDSRPKLMTLESAAARLIVPEEQIRQVLDSKGVPLYAITQDMVRLSEDDFAVFMANCRMRPFNLKSSIEMPEENPSKDAETKMPRNPSPQPNGQPSRKGNNNQQGKKDRSGNNRGNGQQSNLRPEQKGKNGGKQPFTKEPRAPFVPPVVPGNNLADDESPNFTKPAVQRDRKEEKLLPDIPAKTTKPAIEALFVPQAPAPVTEIISSAPQESVIDKPLLEDAAPEPATGFADMISVPDGNAAGNTEEMPAESEAEPTFEENLPEQAEPAQEVTLEDETGKDEDSFEDFEPEADADTDVDVDANAGIKAEMDASNDCLAFFNKPSLPSMSESHDDDDFEMGDNSFREETASEPPSAPSYRNNRG